MLYLGPEPLKGWTAMGLIESLKEIVNGPRSGNTRALSFVCKTKAWVNQIGIAAQLSNCNYTILTDPEKGTEQYSVYVAGTLEQLRECVARLEAMRKKQ